ncbi:hypothetical protein E1265_21300 [Streptomyces sp. 8K308]|uniref:hypothetical protein n=1 Tax=Streptomyces sp. 8K308 TaxID=2530388 RepID=UPI001053898A|nr:hypothetical protein [Streptomyces sp. 8K308]TDC20609.1 hypothetical protein E1265_21300 [Streptomyces sp. 8K308]
MPRDLRQALERALERRYAPGTTTDVRGMMQALEQHHGTKKAAAAAAGIPRSTWGFWDAGKRKPSGANLARLRAAYGPVRRQMIRARIDRLGLPREVHITAQVTPNGDPKYRNSQKGRGGVEGDRMFKAGGIGHGGVNGLPQTDMSAMVAAWIAGGDPVPHLMSGILATYPEFDSIEFGGPNDVIVSLE